MSKTNKMNRVAEMNKEIFRDNLLLTLKEIISEAELVQKKLKFMIFPIEEKGKGYDAMDDIMRLVLLSKENVGNKLLSINTVVNLLAGDSPFVPIWINVSLYNKDDDMYVFKLETSLRRRKPSLLKNFETGHPPFKAKLV